MTAKQRKCSECGDKYSPRTSLQSVCDLNCALKQSRAKRKARDAKITTEAMAQDRRKLKARREALKSKGDWTREAQRAFNAFIRARDYGKPCISSGRDMSDTGLLTGSRVDAGHYRSTGAASHLRFNCWNCHAQSVKDNRELSGNAVEYRMRLIKKIGLARVEALECDNEPRTFDIEYLKRVKKIFNRRARHYKKLRGIA